MASDQASTTVCVVCWVIINLLILPYDAYWLYQFWQHRDKLIIHKRKPAIFIVKEIALWTWILFFFTMYAIIIEHNGINGKIVDILLSIIIIVLSPLIWINSLLHLARYWLIFYMINYNAIIIKNEWQSVIDPSTQTQNFYINHKTKIGSGTYIAKYLALYGFVCWFTCIFPYILSICDAADIIISFFTVIAWSFFSILGAFLLMFLYIFMLFKIPRINDDIGIRAELKFSLWAILTIMILTCILITILWYFSESWNENDKNILFYIWFTIIRIVFLAASLKHTKWPLTKFKEIVIGRHSDARMLELAHQSTYRRIDKQSELELLNIESEEDYVLRQEMRDTLQNSELFDLFMLHLLNEYCAECLLSIIEMIQFKKKIINDNKDVKFDISDLESVCTLILPEKCPKSFIIYGDEDPNYVRNYAHMAMKLYDRYIRMGSEWEINIDFNNRSKYRGIFENDNLDLGNDDKEKLYKLFNPCIRSMQTLILSAFARFKNTKQYKLVQNYSPPASISPRMQIIEKNNKSDVNKNVFENNED